MAIAPILLATRGLTGERDPSRLKTGDLIIAENLDFTSSNLVQKEGGSSKFNATPLSSAPVVTTGIDWWPTASLQRQIVATADGKLYRDTMVGTFGTTLKTGLGSNKITQFLEVGGELAGNNRKLFSINGNDPIQVLSGDGTTTTNIATPPTEWTGANQPSFGFLFRNSFVAGGALNDPHRVYGSDPTNHENLTNGSSYSINVYPGEGQRLVAGISSTSRGFLWKYPQGVYWINDSGSTTASWYVQPATRQFGAAPTPHAVAQVDQATIAFISNTGDIILMRETSGTLSGVEFVDLMKALNLRSFLKTNINLARLNRAQLRWYEDKKQLHAIFCALGSTVEDRRLVIDFNEENTRVSFSNKDKNSSIWMVQDSDNIPRPYLGDNTGTVWVADRNTRDVAGAAYNFNITTAATDFSDLDPKYMVKKLFYRLHLEYEPTGTYDLGVGVIVDGRTIGTVTFDQSGGGAVLPFTLPMVLGGPELRRRSKDIAGEGYYFSLRILEGTTNNPKLSRAWVEFDPTTPAR